MKQGLIPATLGFMLLASFQVSKDLADYLLDSRAVLFPLNY